MTRLRETCRLEEMRSSAARNVGIIEAPLGQNDVSLKLTTGEYFLLTTSSQNAVTLCLVFVIELNRLEYTQHETLKIASHLQLTARYFFQFNVCVTMLSISP